MVSLYLGVGGVRSRVLILSVFILDCESVGFEVVVVKNILRLRYLARDNVRATFLIVVGTD